MGRRLLAGERPERVVVGELAEEELQQSRVAELHLATRRLVQPVEERLAAVGGDGIGAAPPPVVLALLGEEARAGEPVRLGVELRMREGPEVTEGHLDEALEVIGRGRPAHRDAAEYDVRRRAETDA